MNTVDHYIITLSLTIAIQVNYSILNPIQCGFGARDAGGLCSFNGNVIKLY